MARMPPIGPSMPRVGSPGFCSLLFTYRLLSRARFASLYSHHICLALNQHALMFRFGFGSTRTLSFIYRFSSICHSRGGPCVLAYVTATCPPAFSFSAYVQFFIFLFSARSLLPLSCDTTCLVSHSTLSSISHTPDTPTRTSDTPRTPSTSDTLASPYTRTIAFRNLARIFLSAPNIIIRRRSMPPIVSALVPAPVWVFFGAHLV